MTSANQTQAPPPSVQVNDSMVEEVAAVLAATVVVAVAISALARLFSVPAAVVEALTKLVPLSRLRALVDNPYGRAVATPRQLMVRHERVFLVSYLFNASQRLDHARRYGNPREALELEARYYEQYLEARKNRARVAERVQEARRNHGDLLGWHAVRDALTGPECRAAHGGNYPSMSMPKIGWPGSAHPTCRCKPGPPFKGGRMLPVRRVV